jgi:hypothetical protein
MYFPKVLALKFFQIYANKSLLLLIIFKNRF